MNLFTFLIELISAKYDPNLNKITGCKEGSFIYNHEFRHLIQEQKYKYFTILTHLIWLGLGLIVISENYNIAKYLLILLFVPEIDAWCYALRIEFKQKS